MISISFNLKKVNSEFLRKNFVCKKPLILDNMTSDKEKDFKGQKILFQNINKFYPDCINASIFSTPKEQNEAIREAVRGFWMQGNPERMDYVFAMYQGKIKGVYKVVNKDGAFFSFMDTKQSNYPWFDKLPDRKADNACAKKIYCELLHKGCIGQGNGNRVQWMDNRIKKKIYSYLSDDAKKIVFDSYKRDYFAWLHNKKDNDNFRETFYNDFLKNLIKRKYYILEDINKGTDPDFKKYINCSVKKTVDGVAESIFAGNKIKDNNGNFIKTKAGKFKRARPANYVYYPQS